MLFLVAPRLYNGFFLFYNGYITVKALQLYYNRKYIYNCYKYSNGCKFFIFPIVICIGNISAKSGVYISVPNFLRLYLSNYERSNLSLLEHSRLLLR